MKQKLSNYFILVILLVISCKSSTKTDSFVEQRKAYKTKLIPNSYVADGPTAVPPPEIFKLIKYKSDVGMLDAYLNTNIDTTAKLPAIVWAHGGFGGIGDWFWEEGSSIEPFLNSGMVLMCPSWRGENANPGKFELFYGEVNDLSAAIDYVKNLPYVDPNRIYLAGHSTGGTLTLLTSLMNPNIRAAFSFGGAPDIDAVVSKGEGFGNTPYDYHDEKESYLRSAINFTEDILCPIYYFEGAGSFYPPFAEMMAEKARANGKKMDAYLLQNGDHFTIVSPISALIVKKIKADTGPKTNIKFFQVELDGALR